MPQKPIADIKTGRCAGQLNVELAITDVYLQ